MSNWAQLPPSQVKGLFNLACRLSDLKTNNAWHTEMTIFVECHCGMFSGIAPPPQKKILFLKAKPILWPTINGFTPNSSYIGQTFPIQFCSVASKTEQCYRIPHSIFKTFHWTTMKPRDWSFIHEWTDNLWPGRDWSL